MDKEGKGRTARSILWRWCRVLFDRCCTASLSQGPTGRLHIHSNKRRHGLEGDKAKVDLPGFGSVRRDDRESTTLRSESAGLQFVFRMSRQIAPDLLFLATSTGLDGNGQGESFGREVERTLRCYSDFLGLGSKEGEGG